MKKPQRVRFVVVLLLAGLLLPNAARAHGGGVPQVTAAPSGKYLLYVWTEPATPRAGDTVHVTVGVTLPGVNGGDETPISDAAVTVRFTPQGGGAPVEMPATAGVSAGSLYYEADTRLPAAGNWQVAVTVAGAQGEGAAHFVLPVIESRATGYGYMLLGLLFVGAGIGMFIRQRRRAKARPGQAGA